MKRLFSIGRLSVYWSTSCYWGVWRGTIVHKANLGPITVLIFVAEG